VPHLAKGLYEPARNSISKFVQDPYLLLDHNSRSSSPIVVVPKPKEPDMPRIRGEYARVNALFLHYPMAIPAPSGVVLAITDKRDGRVYLD